MSDARDASALSLVEVLLEFVEAAIHQLLFVRKLYAEELFERQRLYGIAVRKSRHPDLNQYISEAVSSLRAALLSGTLLRLVLLVRKPDNTPAERFVIEPRLLGVGEGTALDLEAIESQLKGALLKLQYSDSYLSPLPPGCSFELCAYTSSRSGIDQLRWVEEQRPSQHQQQGQQHSGLGLAAGGPPAATQLELSAAEIIPIKSCALDGAFQLQLYAEA